MRTQLKRQRSMNIRGLQTISDLFDSSEVNVFKKEIANDLWSCCVRENYLVPRRSREDIVHVLKLAIVWNLTQIDPDDFSLVVHDDRLLTRQPPQSSPPNKFHNGKSDWHHGSTTTTNVRVRCRPEVHHPIVFTGRVTASNCLLRSSLL
jgi:hypothetical protein